jgi:chromosome segregation ATPase
MNANNDLMNENKNLSEKIKNLKIQIGENENKIDNLMAVSNEFNKLKSEVEKYNKNILEKDNTIKQLEERYEALRLMKSAQVKTLVSKKGNYEDEIKKKNIQITELMSLIKEIQNSLEGKNHLENQQAEIIESQLQRIDKLELIINDSDLEKD